jgi:hypothetical protein
MFMRRYIQKAGVAIGARGKLHTLARSLAAKDSPQPVMRHPDPVDTLGGRDSPMQEDRLLACTPFHDSHTYSR